MIWFDPEKGHGYIESEYGTEIFVHYSSVVCEESDCSIEAGNRVQFTVVAGPKGPQAQNVVVMNLAS